MRDIDEQGLVERIEDLQSQLPTAADMNLMWTVHVDNSIQYQQLFQIVSILRKSQPTNFDFDRMEVIDNINVYLDNSMHRNVEELLISHGYVVSKISAATKTNEYNISWKIAHQKESNSTEVEVVKLNSWEIKSQ